VALALGNEAATKFAKALTTPPPSLAKKLGLRIAAHDRRNRRLGTGESYLRAKEVTNRSGDLILARVDTPLSDGGDQEAADDLSRGVPIWFIYPKGPGHALNEHIVRATALATESWIRRLRGFRCTDGFAICKAEELSSSFAVLPNSSQNHCGKQQIWRRGGGCLIGTDWSHS